MTAKNHAFSRNLLQSWHTYEMEKLEFFDITIITITYDIILHFMLET